MRLATSRCNPACQERRSSWFAARSRANAFCHSRLQTRIAGVRHQISQHSHKSGAAPRASVFIGFYVKSSSRLSLVRILPASSFKSDTGMPVFKHFEMQIELSLQSCARFGDNCPRSRPAAAETKTSATMMLTWGWHDDKTAPGHSSVTRKFSN